VIPREQFARMNRRQFLALGALPVLAQHSAAVRLGIDLFSIRSQGWSPFEYLDYCARQGARVVHFSEIRFLGSLEAEHLRQVREHAQQLGIQLEIGMRSICPTSTMFEPKLGTAEEQLVRMIEAAKTIGSPIVRAVLGSMADRTPPGIESHIEDTVRVLRAVRTRAVDTGIKIAIENHAGDMQAWELVTLIETAGKEYVGATLDSGNATWTMEDPLTSLETLAPYVLSTGIRDSMVWEDANGAQVQWTALGEGLVEWPKYVEKFAALCPAAPFNLEIISGFAHPVPYLKEGFWDVWPKARASDFVKFLALARRGKPLGSHKSPDAKAEQEYQKEQLERSLRYAKEVLGLGLK